MAANIQNTGYRAKFHPAQVFDDSLKVVQSSGYSYSVFRITE
jgi:hypothetical protein